MAVTRDIRPPTTTTICDVCGRTLLRGERAEPYLDGGARRWVCELCKSRALGEGWVREGSIPSDDQNPVGSERRRSLLARLRPWRENPGESAIVSAAEHDGVAPIHASRWSGHVSGDGRSLFRREHPRDRAREPRHVRAIPTSTEQKIASAIHLFNSSEHTRTVSGVARALGLPAVTVSPSSARASLVNVVTSWELCWYRYEVDLSDEVLSVRVVARGYELDELTPQERRANAAADQNGRLSMPR